MMWKCSLCDEKFDTEKELRKHQRNCYMLKYEKDTEI